MFGRQKLARVQARVRKAVQSDRPGTSLFGIYAHRYAKGPPKQEQRQRRSLVASVVRANRRAGGIASQHGPIGKNSGHSHNPEHPHV